MRDASIPQNDSPKFALFWRAWLLPTQVLILTLLFASVARAQLLAPVDAADVEHERRIVMAIDIGVESLMKGLEAQIEGKASPGQLALQIYALLVSGVSEEEPLIRRGLERLEQEIPIEGNTYAISCAMLALDAAIAQMEYDAFIMLTPEEREQKQKTSRVGMTYRAQMRLLTRQLLAYQHASGGWRYGERPSGADNSCTQFVVLALGAAARRGARVPPKVWSSIASYFLSCQALEGPPTRKRVRLHPSGEGGRGSVSVRRVNPAKGKAQRQDYKRGGAIPARSGGGHRRGSGVCARVVVSS